MLIGPNKNMANDGKGMYVGAKQPREDGERCVTSIRASSKETNSQPVLIDQRARWCLTQIDHET